MSSTSNDKLQLRFDPRTIEHLGIKMYSQLPYALAELVANSYDAGAENVLIDLFDEDPSNKKIIVSDDGEGMSFDEIQDKFLVIGRKRRDTDESRSNFKGRKITGKKGVGKLALFGIGKTITIETSKKEEQKKTQFILDWDEILKETREIYYPNSKTIRKENNKDYGTTITLQRLTRISNFDQYATAVSLSRLFNCFDADFSITILHNSKNPIKLTRDLIYKGIGVEFKWNISDIIDKIDSEYEYKKDIKGQILSSKKPISPNLRGITLYANGRLVNVPSFFEISEAGHAFSYLSGWIDVDFLDEFEEDLISTDRQSLSWDLPIVNELQKFLQQIIKYLVRDWNAKRKEAKEKLITTRSGVNLTEWFGKVPFSIKPKLEQVIDAVSKKSEIDEEDFSDVVHKVHDLIPPYTYYHYRLLNKEIQIASKESYEKKDYYKAIQEALKRYKNAVKDKSGVKDENDLSIMSNSFGKGKPLITTAKYQKRPNGKPFSERTLENVEEGQCALSMGIVKGARNVISHEEQQDLIESGLFTEQDCLDFLSLLSHLFKRLEAAQKRK